jgi:hypothetical protein
LERAAGRANLVSIFVSSVFWGGVLSMFMEPSRPSLGVSGGDFGLIAAMIVFGWKQWDDLPNRSRRYFGWAMLPYLVLSIVSGVYSNNVDNWSHFGGMLCGIVMMSALTPEIINPQRNRLVRGLSWLLIGTMCAFIQWKGVELVPLSEESGHGLTTVRPSYWNPGEVFTGDHGWFSPTLRATASTTTTVQAVLVGGRVVVEPKE